MAHEADRPGVEFPKITCWVLMAALLGLVAAIIVLGWVPPVDRDALTHHLAVPKLYLQHGGIFEIPWIEFSYYPMNLDLLYMVPLALGSDIAPKFVHFAFALLTAGLLFRYLKGKIDVRYGLLGALAFLSVPVIVKLSVTAYVDLGLIFFSTASLLALLRWAEREFQWRYLMVAAVSCGLALGTKYNGLIVLFCVAVMVPLLYVRGGDPSSARQVKAVGMGAVFVLIAALVFSPWMVRDYIWTGNPVYPLYKGVFSSAPAHGGQPSQVADGKGKAESVEKADAEMAGDAPEPGLGHFRMRKLVFGESGLEILAIPLRVFFQGRDDDPKYFDGQLNPFLLILSLVAAAGGRKMSAGGPIRDQKVLLAFAALYLLVAYVQIDMRARWIAPIIPPLVIVSMMGLHRLELRGNEMLHLLHKVLVGSAFWGVVLVMMSLNLSYLQEQFNVIRPWDYISGKTSREEYITRYRREYPVIQYMNLAIQPESRVLAFFLGGRTYYSDRTIDCRYSIFLMRCVFQIHPQSWFVFCGM